MTLPHTYDNKQRLNLSVNVMYFPQPQPPLLNLITLNHLSLLYSTTTTSTSSLSSLDLQSERDRVARLKMAALCDQSGWAMEPSFFIILAMVPYVLSNMGIPWILTLPLAAGIL